MGKKLILLLGKSGSGKNYLVNKMGWDPVVSYTTRSMRKGETDGLEHHFVDYHYYRDFRKSDMYAWTFFDYNHYWSSKEDIEDKDVYIIDPAGVYDLEDTTFNVEILYLDTPLFRRIKQMYGRGDGIVNIVKRLINDRGEFKNVKKLADLVISYT